jgi:hypothetical protein
MTHLRAIRKAAVCCFTGARPLNAQVRRDEVSRQGWKLNLLDALADTPLIGPNPHIPTLLPRRMRPTTRVPPGCREEILINPLDLGQRADENTPLIAVSAASPSASSVETDPLLDSIYDGCLDLCCPVS